jgi:hypothetical protein
MRYKRFSRVAWTFSIPNSGSFQGKGLLQQPRDLSPTSPSFRLAPKCILPVPQLHSLIAIEINAESRIIVFGEFEPERLDSLAV